MSDSNMKSRVEAKYSREDRTVDAEHDDVGQMTMLFCTDAASFYTIKDY